MELVQLLKAIGDSNRIRIINILKSSELCVCDIENILGINQSNASRHLEKLKNVGLITFEKRAQWVYYKLNSNIYNKYPFIKELVYDELEKLDECKKDNESLNAHKKSGTCC
jgi:ArsR family transcriptional regulator, arsenate/arsenite/antimonite-responsive transcriptional repressor